MKKYRVYLKAVLSIFFFSSIVTEILPQEPFVVAIDRNKIQCVVLKNIRGDVLIEGIQEGKISIGVQNYQINTETRHLKPINIPGKNTGLGFAVFESEDEIMITGLSGNQGLRYTIKLPESMPVKAIWEGHDYFGEVVVRGLKSDLEMKRINGNIILEDISGPLSLYTMDARLDISFSSLTPDKPNSISSYHSHIKLKLPPGSPASFEMRTGRGEVFADFEMEQIRVSQENNDDCVDCVPEKTFANINGGGANFILNTYAGNIYLMKNK